MTRRGSIVGLLATAAVLASIAPAEAGFLHKSGVIGVVRGQTARVNVAHIGCPSDPAAVAREPTCAVSVKFLAGDGSVLPAVQMPATLMLEPCKAGFVDLSDTAFGNGRLAFRVEVGAATKACSNNLLPTLEIFDSDTGRALIGLLLPAVQKVREAAIR